MEGLAGALTGDAEDIRLGPFGNGGQNLLQEETPLWELRARESMTTHDAWKITGT
jgi:hypothetical protein